MKKKTFNLPFKSNFFKEQDPFHFVIIFFIIFFSTAVFFSIPSFYDYKKYNQKIETTINNEFKIKMHNLEGISFRFIPTPHLLIKKADLKINENETKVISQLKNVKVFISITELYKKKNFKIKRIVVKKANLYLTDVSLKNFINNLKKNIVNNFIIKKSILFYKDQKEEIILISKIKNFDYKIDFINNKKILIMDGNLFDSDYEFKYLIDYNFPNIQNVLLKLKNPNITLENNLIDDLYSYNLNQEGKLVIKFLNLKNIINYEVKENNIKFINKNKKNSHFDIDGLVNFKPFHFDLLINYKMINLIKLENFLYKIYTNKDLELENLFGLIKLNFNKINSKIINTGHLSLKFENSKLFLEDKKFYLKDFAILEVDDYEYLRDFDQILQMKIKINIFNNEKFNRLLFNYRNNKILSENIYFTYRFEANTKKHFLSTISDKGFVKNNEFFEFKNLQQLKNLLLNENIFKLD